MVAIAEKSFYMQHGTVTSKQGKPLKDRQFVVIGDQFTVLSEGTLVDPKNGRKYNVASCSENFLKMDKAPQCVWCALGYTRGGEKTGAGPNDHAIGGSGGGVIFIHGCTDLVAA